MAINQIALALKCPRVRCVTSEWTLVCSVDEMWEVVDAALYGVGMRVRVVLYFRKKNGGRVGRKFQSTLDPLIELENTLLFERGISNRHKNLPLLSVTATLNVDGECVAQPALQGVVTNY